MKKQINQVTLKKDWRQTGILHGVKVQQIPLLGNAAYQGVGSDTYSYTILQVTDDYKGFAYGKDGRIYGWAVLVTRKNSKVAGRYVEAKTDMDGKEAWPLKPLMHGRYTYLNVVWPDDKPGNEEDHLDPSF